MSRNPQCFMRMLAAAPHPTVRGVSGLLEGHRYALPVDAAKELAANGLAVLDPGKADSMPGVADPAALAEELAELVRQHKAAAEAQAEAARAAEEPEPDPDPGDPSDEGLLEEPDPELLERLGEEG